MNRNNLDLLIDSLEDGTVYGKDVRFRMDFFVLENYCGTAACLAGHCALLGRMEDYNHGGVFDFAMDWLEIPFSIAKPMFLEPGELKYAQITTAVAVKMLENFRATNKVEWSL